LCETSDILESQYRHIPTADSPVTYPLKPHKIAATSIPLAAGAERYYRKSIFSRRLPSLQIHKRLSCLQEAHDECRRQTIELLVASMSGTAEMVADELAQEIKSRGLTARIICIEKAKLPCSRNIKRSLSAR